MPKTKYKIETIKFPIDLTTVNGLSNAIGSIWLLKNDILIFTQFSAGEFKFVCPLSGNRYCDKPFNRQDTERFIEYIIKNKMTYINVNLSKYLNAKTLKALYGVKIEYTKHKI